MSTCDNCTIQVAKFYSDGSHDNPRWTCDKCKRLWMFSLGSWRAHPAPPDPVNHPAHYTAHPSGVECITVTEHFGFNLGNAIKYIWRAEEKGALLQDLKKARWYLDREIARREKKP